MFNPDLCDCFWTPILEKGYCCPDTIRCFALTSKSNYNSYCDNMTFFYKISNQGIETNEILLKTRYYYIVNDTIKEYIDYKNRSYSVCSSWTLFLFKPAYNIAFHLFARSSKKKCYYQGRGHMKLYTERSYDINDDSVSTEKLDILMSFDEF